MNYTQKIRLNTKSIFVLLASVGFAIVLLQMYFSYSSMIYTNNINIVQDEIYEMRHKMLDINSDKIKLSNNIDELTHIVVIEKTKGLSLSLSR